MVTNVKSSPPVGGSGWLVCLLLTTFVIGTDDFVVAGVLPAIAADLNVSEAAAGQLVTVFSLTYAVAAPPLAMATARLPRRALLLGGLSIFAIANICTALAPNYTVLMTMRVATALIAATVSPAAFAMAGRLAAPERVGRAIGVVAAGLTVSLFVGVPVGTVLGDHLGWRWTFVAVGLFTVTVIAASAYLLPKVPGAPQLGVRQQLRVLSRPAILLSVLGTVVGASCGLMTYTYIAPVTQSLTGRGGTVLAALIAVVGVAAAVGTFVGGRLTDRWGTDRTLLTTFSGVVASTALLAVLDGTGHGTTPVWVVGAVLAVWGFGGYAFNPPMNTRAMRLAGDAGTEAVALNTSGMYVGIAAGGAVGGTVLAGYGGIGVTTTAAVIGVAALALYAVTVRRFPVRNTSADGATGADVDADTRASTEAAQPSP